MSKYVIKYSRGDEVKYISHLDFVRFIHRVIRRANLPMEFSQGFNPHPVMTVAMPLSVGVTASGELMKIGFDGEFSEEFIKETLNNNMPIGFKIVDVKKDKNLDFSKLDRAEYIVKLNTECDFDIDEFLKNPELKVMKKSKSGIKEADIRPYIYKLETISKEGGCLCLKMCLAAGNIYNLKPESVIDAMKKYTEGFLVDFFTVHREKLLAGDKEII